MPTLYDNFERVRQYIDQHQGGGGDMSAYVTKDELSAQSYLTSIPNTYASYNGVYSYLYDTLGISHGGSQGVAYIDAAELHDVELTGDISINGIHTDQLPTYAAISEMGYMTQADSYAYLSIENLRTNNNRPVQLRAVGLQFISSNYTIAPREISYEYINTSSYNNAWVGNTTLKNYVNGRLAQIEASYVTSSDLPVIDESIIPKETSTYTLGDADHMYKSTYSSGFYTRVSNLTGFENNGNYTGIYAKVGGNNKLDINSNDIRPVSNKNYNLGATNNWYGKTYTDVLFTNTAYLQDTSYTKSIVPDGTDTYFLGNTSNYYHSTYTNRIRGNSSVNFVTGGNNRVTVTGTTFRPMQQNYNLGTSDYPFATAYISNIYNFIWTGTSAEYAALSDYTTYQIYMIKEV